MFSRLRALFVLAIAVLAVSPAAAENVTFPDVQLWPDPKAITVSGVLSKPKGNGPFPAVVILPNCGGPKKYESASFWPAYLNKLGYVTLNVDPFTPRKAKKCSKQFKPKNKEMAQDAYGALNYLAGLDFVAKDRVGVLGSSLGAMGINWFSKFGKTTPDGLGFKAGVSLYAPTCETVSPNDRMLHLLIILGDREKGAASCQSLPDHEKLAVHVFPNVYHGFDQPTAKPRKNGQLQQDVYGNKMLYNPAVTLKAQELVKEFLAVRLAAHSPSPPPATPERNSPESGGKLPKIGGKDPYIAVSRRDKDGDGKVSAAEWDKSPDIFAKIDADGDGFITPQEFHDRWKSQQ